MYILLYLLCLHIPGVQTAICLHVPGVQTAICLHVPGVQTAICLHVPGVQTAICLHVPGVQTAICLHIPGVQTAIMSACSWCTYCCVCICVSGVPDVSVCLNTCARGFLFLKLFFLNWVCLCVFDMCTGCSVVFPYGY